MAAFDDYQAPDVNCNDLIEVIVKVNGKQYYRRADMINTQKEWYQYQTDCMAMIERMKLKDLSRFKPI